MSKHSPGPWSVEYSEATKVKATDDSTLAFLGHLNRRGRRSPEQVGANARLIAAAPDLLAALEAMVAAARRGGDPQVSIDEECDAWQLIDHAIAKAKGEGS